MITQQSQSKMNRDRLKDYYIEELNKYAIKTMHWNSMELYK